MKSADGMPEPLTRCDRCVWWVSTGDESGHCPYRAASVGSNSQWKDIVLGRCSHFLGDPDLELSPAVGALDVAPSEVDLGLDDPTTDERRHQHDHLTADEQP